MKKKSTAEEYKNVSDVVSRIDSICLNCPTCHFHAFAEDLGPAPGSNWGTAKQDAVQAELLLAVDLPSARCTVGGYDTHQEDLAGCGHTMKYFAGYPCLIRCHRSLTYETFCVKSGKIRVRPVQEEIKRFHIRIINAGVRDTSVVLVKLVCLSHLKLKLLPMN